MLGIDAIIFFLIATEDSDGIMNSCVFLGAKSGFDDLMNVGEYHCGGFRFSAVEFLVALFSARAKES